MFKKVIVFLVGVVAGTVVFSVKADYTPAMEEQQVIEENVEWTENEEGEMIGNVKCTAHCGSVTFDGCNVPTADGNGCVIRPLEYKEICAKWGIK